MPGGILVLTGPTATGKTALGVRLAKLLDGEVVSCDAMQVYRGMVIGTAAPTPEETEGVPHHLVGFVDPTEDYSAARYAEDASACVEDILGRGKLPILVGGTGLYIDALLRQGGFSGGDADLRRQLEEEYEALGGAAMREKLRAVDPERAEKLHENDKKRIVRALEVFFSTGETITDHDARTRALPPRYPSVTVALNFRERETLYRRIDLRVERMLEQGLENEVRSLLESGLREGSTAMQAIGYKELAAAIRGDVSMAQAVEDIKRESRRYAKRQLSWLRARGAEVHWQLWENVPNFQEACVFSTKILENSGIL